MIGLDRHGSHARSRRNELIYYSYYVPYITIPEYTVNLRNVFSISSNNMILVSYGLLLYVQS